MAVLPLLFARGFTRAQDARIPAHADPTRTRLDPVVGPSASEAQIGALGDAALLDEGSSRFCEEVVLDKESPVLDAVETDERIGTIQHASDRIPPQAADERPASMHGKARDDGQEAQTEDIPGLKERSHQVLRDGDGIATELRAMDRRPDGAAFPEIIASWDTLMNYPDAEFVRRNHAIGLWYGEDLDLRPWVPTGEKTEVGIDRQDRIFNVLKLSDRIVAYPLNARKPMRAMFLTTEGHLFAIANDGELHQFTWSRWKARLGIVTSWALEFGQETRAALAEASRLFAALKEAGIPRSFGQLWGARRWSWSDFAAGLSFCAICLAGIATAVGVVNLLWISSVLPAIPPVGIAMLIGLTGVSTLLSYGLIAANRYEWQNEMVDGFVPLGTRVPISKAFERDPLTNSMRPTDDLRQAIASAPWHPEWKEDFNVRKEHESLPRAIPPRVYDPYYVSRKTE